MSGDSRRHSPSFGSNLNLLVRKIKKRAKLARARQHLRAMDVVAEPAGSGAQRKRRLKRGRESSAAGQANVVTKRLPSGSFLYRTHWLAEDVRFVRDEMERLVGWDVFSTRATATGGRPIDAKTRRVLEYQTARPLLLLSVPKGSVPPRPQVLIGASTATAAAGAPTGQERPFTPPVAVGGDAKVPGDTPIKTGSGRQSRGPRIVADAEGLDGWCSGSVVCLREPKSLRLIDDDKKSGLSQQLLTDMFSKMRLSKSL